MQINDRWMFLGLYPLLALLVVYIGNDNSLAFLLRHPSHYSDLLLALICTYAIGGYLRYVHRRTHEEYLADEGQRAKLPIWILVGVLLPVTFAIGAELIYLSLLPGIRMAETSVFYLELPLAVLFVLLINLIYYLLYTRRHHQLVLGADAGSKEEERVPTYRRDFLVHGALKSKVIELEEVAYFVILEKSTYLVNKAGRTFPYEASLEQVVEATDPTIFFQANRQLLVRRAGVVGYKRTDTRRLELELQPASAEAHFVPKTKAADFIKWLEAEGRPSEAGK